MEATVLVDGWGLAKKKTHCTALDDALHWDILPDPRVSFALLPSELKTHFGPASECEGAEKEDEVDEEEAEYGPVLAPHADDSGTAGDSTHTAVSTLNSAHSQEHHRSHHQLDAQLGRLKQETNRCVQTHTYECETGFCVNRRQRGGCQSSIRQLTV